MPGLAAIVRAPSRSVSVNDPFPWKRSVAVTVPAAIDVVYERADVPLMVCVTIVVPAMASIAVAASIRPRATSALTCWAEPSSADVTWAALASGCAESASAARPATSGAADDVPQNSPYPPERTGATLQPGAAKLTQCP